MYLFLLLKWCQSSIYWSVMCRFHCFHSLSLIAIYCHVLLLVVSFTDTICHSLYHSLSLVATRCYSLLLIVPLVVTRCHSLSLDVFHCHSWYHSLSLVVIRCHSLYHLLSLVVTRCTTRLSFYKWSEFHLVLKQLLITVHFVDRSIFDVMILLWKKYFH